MRQLDLFDTCLLNELEKGFIRCHLCKKEKPLEEFGSDKARKNNKNIYCKVCALAKYREYMSSPEAKAKKKARNKIYDATEKGKAAKRARRRAWYEKNAGKYRGRYQHYHYQRNKVLQQRFNLTEAEYDAMLTSQSGVCAICKRPESRKRRDGSFYALAVDHNHSTGEIRGLLCRQCNTTLAYFENTKFLNSALDYLGLGIVNTQTTEEAS